MKVDAYKSAADGSWGVLVPTGADPAALQGQVLERVSKLSPLNPVKKNVLLTDMFHGDMPESLQKQIQEHGAALVKIDVTTSVKFEGE